MTKNIRTELDNFFKCIIISLDTGSKTSDSPDSQTEKTTASLKSKTYDSPDSQTEYIDSYSKTIDIRLPTEYIDI